MYSDGSLRFAYDEEFGGELGPGWLLKESIVHPDLLIAAGITLTKRRAFTGEPTRHATHSFSTPSKPQLNVGFTQTKIGVLPQPWNSNFVPANQCLRETPLCLDRAPLRLCSPNVTPQHKVSAFARCSKNC